MAQAPEQTMLTIPPGLMLSQEPLQSPMGILDSGANSLCTEDWKFVN